jgi:hypothetical protein
MKQHLLAEQLKELPYKERVTLLSLVTGLTKEYLKSEYEYGTKNEDGMLAAYGYTVMVGELIELIENYTRRFPIPTINESKYNVAVTFKNHENNIVELSSGYKTSYCDALYEIVKKLLSEKYIE